MTTQSLCLTALPGIPLVHPGDDLATLISDGLQRAQITLQDGDVVVLASKIVAKTEGRYVDLGNVQPSEEAVKLAEETGKDARIVELVLQESVGISRKAPGVLVVQHRLGFISANAGIDQSNVEGGDERVLLMPLDPDTTAQTLCEQLHATTGANIGVLIADSHGRPFRRGSVGAAIGVAGMPALVDLRGQDDLFGRKLRISIQGYADMVASAGLLLTGEAAEGQPVIHLRGLQYSTTDGRAAHLNRPPEQDLYR